MVYKKTYLLIAMLVIFSAFVTPFCGELINTFSDGAYEDSILFSSGGSTNTSTKIIVPMLSGGTTISNAVVNLTGMPKSLTLDKPVDVVLVTDVSSSMDDDCGADGVAQPGEHPCKIEDAKNADRGFVNLITTVDNNTVGLVSYSTTLVNSVPLTNDNNTLKTEIDSYYPWGFTCIECGIQEGINQAVLGQNQVKAIIVMSDGEANRCISGYCNPPVAKSRAIAKAAEAWNVYGIHVYAIAFDGQSDKATMMAIAQAGNGTYNYSNNSNIYQIYQDIAVELTQVFPTDPELDIGSNSVVDWQYVGEYDGNEQVNFTSELDGIMDSCTCPGCFINGSDCVVDMEIASQTTGSILFHDLQIIYHHTVDTTCDGIDDDCDLVNDDDYATVACGQGECSGGTICIQNGSLNSGDAYVDCQDQSISQLDTDCGICCMCTGTLADPQESYDETQDDDCSDTICVDSCDITPDSNQYTWDFAPDVENFCKDLKQCTDNQCDYQHECHDNDPNDGIGDFSSSCNAECDQNSDCGDKCGAGNVRYYNGVCALGGDCSCSWGSSVDCDDYDLNFSKGFTCNETVGDIFNYHENWQCADGGCEYSGYDWESSLKEDCVDECSDTDSGHDYETIGTVTDDDLCLAGNKTCPTRDYTDYCTDSTLTEFFCTGTDVDSETVDCNDYDNDFFVGQFCNLTDGDIYDYLQDWDCGLGACSYSGTNWQNDSSKIDCEDTCADPDGIDKYIATTVNDKDLCDELDEVICPEVDKTDVCYDSGNVTEYYCNGTNYASQIMNCDDDDCTTPSQFTCEGIGTDTIFEQGDDYGCSAGACGLVGKTTCAGPWECNSTTLCTQQDCGADSPTCFFDNGYQWGDAGNETQCSNGIDDDCDGLIDCADPDCFGVNQGLACGTGTCSGERFCDSTGQNTWHCSSNGTICSSTDYCDDATICDGYQMFAVCDITGVCGSEDNRNDDIDTACGGQDCGICCECDSNGGRIFDGTQDNDCSDTYCVGGCDEDGNPDTWDFEHNVSNFCVAVDTCSDNPCNYVSECRDGDEFDGVDTFMCSAECDEESDCPPFLENDVCYYQNTCGTGCGCERNLDENCPQAGTVDGNTCYYGLRYCTDEKGCEILNCTLEPGQYCDNESGCLNQTCIKFTDTFSGSMTFPFDGGSNDSIKRTYSTNTTFFTANGTLSGSALSYKAELDLVVVTDVSKSMENDNKLIEAKKAGKDIVNLLLPSATNKLGLVSYDTSLESSLALTDDNVSLNTEIDSYFPWGFTCISCGINEGINIINAGDNPTKVILVMTDGEANRCTYGYCNPAPAKTEAINFAQTAWEQYGIRVYAVAYGNDADNITMKQIAEKGNGKFFFAGTENITEIYEQIINLSTLMYPTDVELDVGENSVLEFYQAGILNGTFTVANFSSELQGFINTCDTTPCPGCSYNAGSKLCTIDFTLSSSKGGHVDSDFYVDGCTAGSITRPDRDGDGVVDAIDNCPDIYNPDQLDFDADRIGDVCDPDDDNDCLPDTVDLCQFDDDCDNDGLIDGNCGSEDLNNNGHVDLGETDPMNWDSDGDGLSDGQEMGLTKPEGKNTNLSKFKKDDDPSTTTDPLNDDTDGDGIKDGDEDANHNGKVDSGETDPNVADVDSDNDGFTGDFDLCPGESGDCNGCPITCGGCAVEVCPADAIPYCEGDDAQCSPTTCPADECGAGTCADDERANYPLEVANTCSVDQDFGTCTENACTAICEPDSLCGGDCPRLKVDVLGGPFQSGGFVNYEGFLLDEQCNGVPANFIGLDVAQGSKFLFVTQPLTDVNGDFDGMFKLPDNASGEYTLSVAYANLTDSENFTVNDCLLDTDCEDSNECNVDTCNDGVCEYTSVDNGTLCTEGICQGGECMIDLEAPLPPTDLDAEVTNSILLTWTASASSDVSAYNIYVSDEGINNFDFENPVDSVNASTLEWLDTTDHLVQQRYYIVRAEDSAGNEEKNENKVGKITYTLVKKEGGTGNNLISIPLVTGLTHASDVMRDIGEICDGVNRFNPITQKPEGWISFFGGIGTDFDIVPGEGYAISVTENTNWTIAGKIADWPPIFLVKMQGGTGKNWVALPLNTSLGNADDIMQDIGGTCEAVNRWDPVTQTAQGWYLGSGTNFAVSPLEGYEVHVSTNTSWLQ